MRDTSPRRWRRWRVTLAKTEPLPSRIAYLRPAAPVLATTLELPGPDGIRHGLVARVRAEIAAGTYDTEEKWLAAEEALFERVASRM